MNRALAAAWVLAVAAAGAALVAAGRSATRARTDASRALHQLDLVSAQTRELTVLRAKAAAEPTGRERPGSGLAPRIGAALARCGLPASALSSFSPEPETLVPGTESQPRLKRQRATLVLGGATLPQFGAFLDAWRTSEPGWIVTSIDLSRAPEIEGGSAGGDLPLRIVMTIETTYTDDAVPEARQGGAG